MRVRLRRFGLQGRCTGLRGCQLGRIAGVDGRIERDRRLAGELVVGGQHRERGVSAVATSPPPDRCPDDEEPGAESGEGLIRAKGALAHMDRLIGEMVEGIYQARSEETDRKVNL